jgi:hypothetical protein
LVRASGHCWWLGRRSPRPSPSPARSPIESAPATAQHFHHYNIGIALLAGIGAIALRGEDHHRQHPVTATAYGAANALIVDELMLLLDLKDVYWAKDGRTSVDTAVGLIGIGGIYLAAAPFWHDAVRELLHTTAYLPANRRPVASEKLL